MIPLNTDLITTVSILNLKCIGLGKPYKLYHSKSYHKL